MRRPGLKKKKKALELRPTLAITRKSLCSILRPVIGGKKVLELFAGSGSVGKDFLDLGASRVIFVDAHRGRMQKLKKELGSKGVEVITGRLPQALAKVAGENDLIYLDPPYDEGLIEAVMPRLPDLLAPGGIVLAEHRAKHPLKESYGPLVCYRKERYAEAQVSFFEVP